MSNIRNLTTVAIDPSREALRAQRSRAMKQIADDPTPQCVGFSARLNMLCSLAGERHISSGRIDDICALDPQWSRDMVAGWLIDDQIPERPDLRRLLVFLIAQMEQTANPDRWEAYLIYGPDLIDNPALNIRHSTSMEMRALAARELLAITQECGVPDDSYDADACLEKLASMLSILDFTSDDDDLQPGLRRILAAWLFPSHANSGRN